MKEPCNTVAERQGREKGGETVKPVSIQEDPRPPISQRGTDCAGDLKAPSPLHSLVLIVGISTSFIHPREFLFVSSYRFISRSLPALGDDGTEPFAGGF